MNTGWCRNDLNHAKNQSKVEKKCTKIQVSIDFLRNVVKEYNPELQITMEQINCNYSDYYSWEF